MHRYIRCVDMFLQREDHLLHQPVQAVPKDYIQPRLDISDDQRQGSTLLSKSNTLKEYCLVLGHNHPDLHICRSKSYAHHKCLEK